MSLWPLFGAAAFLSLERLCYAWLSRAPEAFCARCTHPAVAWLGKPVEVTKKLFYGFKVMQVAVFMGWCYVYGQGSLWPLSAGTWVLGLGGALLIVGQILNMSVFYRLGKVGVFYGNKLGYEIPRCHAFPFSVLAHPQYVGTLLSIWGFFLIMRFPHDDWCILPTIETVYYVLGAYFEQ